MKKPIVIIGNGISGVTAAREIRKRDANVPLLIISGETDHHFSRTALMYIFMGHMNYEDTKPYEDHFWEKNRIDLVRDYVTSIVCGYNREDDKESEILVSGARDKKVILWKTNADDVESSGGKFGEALVALTGHNHFVSSLSLSSDNNFVLSSSWDKSLRLWNLKSGKCM